MTVRQVASLETTQRVRSPLHTRTATCAPLAEPAIRQTLGIEGPPLPGPDAPTSGSEALSSAATVLIVEADTTFASRLHKGLSRAALDSQVISRASDALVILAGAKPTLLVIDAQLADMSGLDLCATVRSLSTVPILVVNAGHRRLPALEPWRAGADGYVADPGRIGEILARARALIRRAAIPSDSYDTPPLRTGNMFLLPDERSVSIEGRSLDLTPNEYLVLEALVQARGKLLSYATLFELIRRRPPDSEGAKFVNVYINQLRKKLRAAGGTSTIITIRERGCKVVTHHSASHRAMFL